MTIEDTLIIAELSADNIMKVVKTKIAMMQETEDWLYLVFKDSVARAMMEYYSDKIDDDE